MRLTRTYHDKKGLPKTNQRSPRIYQYTNQDLAATIGSPLFSELNRVYLDKCTTHPVTISIYHSVMVIILSSQGRRFKPMGFGEKFEILTTLSYITAAPLAPSLLLFDF